MARKPKKIKDDELVSILRSAIATGEKFTNTKLAKERERGAD